MMKSIICILLLVFNLITFVRNQSFYISPVRITNNCRENELFTNCGSACDPTCENITTITKDRPNYEPYVVLDEPCKYNCIPGCYCRKPYYRNRFGQCVDETQCRKSLNRNDFVEELNKFLNLNLNDYNMGSNTKSNSPDTQTRTNQQYIAVNDNSETVINPRTGYYPNKKNGYQIPSTGYNYNNFFNLEKDFFNNLFDGIFPHHSNQNRQSNQNYNTQYRINSNGNINVNEDENSLERMIEKEADAILQRISNGLRMKKFIIETLRSLVNRSQYDLGSFASSSGDGKDSKNNGLITT